MFHLDFYIIADTGAVSTIKPPWHNIDGAREGPTFDSVMRATASINNQATHTKLQNLTYPHKCHVRSSCKTIIRYSIYRAMTGASKLSVGFSVCRSLAWPDVQTGSVPTKFTSSVGLPRERVLLLLLSNERDKKSRLQLVPSWSISSRQICN